MLPPGKYSDGHTARALRRGTLWRRRDTGGAACNMGYDNGVKTPAHAVGAKYGG